MFATIVITCLFTTKAVVSVHIVKSVRHKKLFNQKLLICIESLVCKLTVLWNVKAM